MSIFSQLNTIVQNTLHTFIAQGILPDGLDFQKIVVEAPRDPNHGDAATNAALALGKSSGLGPKALAEKLVSALLENPFIEKASVAGPGFVNLTFNNQTRTHLLKDILTTPNWGIKNIGQGKPLLLEYLSANPTGPVHVGHTRGAVLGDTLARVWSAAGWKVEREYYVNDAGGQIDTLARSVYKRYEQACGRDVSIDNGLYPGDYLIDIGQKVKEEVETAWLDQPETVWLEKLRIMSTMAMMNIIEEDIESLGLTFDSFFSENSLHRNNLIGMAMKALEAQDLLVTDTVESPKNSKNDGRTQTVFTSTLFGDDKNRPIQKADGSWTYFAADVAYHWDKLRREPEKMVTILGADHSGYVSRLKASVTALSHGQSEMDVILVQMVNLLKNGEPVTMSKRAGTFVTLRDLVDAVGKDAVRFFMLWRDVNSVLTFDFDTVVAQSRENPLYYIQYAHARCFSILDKAQAQDDETLAQTSITLTHESQENIVKHLSQWPDLFKSVAVSGQVHRITTYLYDLATLYHIAWHEGYTNPQLRFTNPENPAGPVLSRATQKVLAQGLDLLGITPLDRM